MPQHLRKLMIVISDALKNYLKLTLREELTEEEFDLMVSQNAIPSKQLGFIWT